MKEKNMKRKGQKQENKILYVALGCVLFVACLCIFAGVFLHFSNKKDAADDLESAEVTALEKEAGAVSAKENATRIFLNQPAPAAAEGDRREVIRIVEIIPHEVCSMFPYLIEWGSKEEYDRQVPIGYEGILYMSADSGLAQFGGNGNNSQGEYSLDKSSIKEYTLRDYNVEFQSAYNKEGAKWWRETDTSKILESNGYFEYVGEGKGLYNINLDDLVDESKAGSDDHGIRYKIQAMERKGTEEPKGEWQVNEPAYFWAKSTSGSGYPTMDVKRTTGYNYDLKFEVAGADDTEYKYRVQSFDVKSTPALEDGKEYDYQAKLKDGVTWTDGYVYWPDGNYTVDDTATVRYIVTESDLSNLSVLSGKYIRIEDDKKSDGMSDYPSGYFRLFNQVTDAEKLKVGDQLYGLAFKATEPGKGMYVLSPAAVNNSVNKEKIEFSYVKNGKGTCAVTFIYAGAGPYSETVYRAEITQVTDGEGAYALTSKADESKELYIKIDGTAGDYSKVVTRIDCANVDYADNTFFGYNSANDSYSDCPGLRMGVDLYNYSVDKEKGAWVFHSVSSDEENGITKIEEVKNGIKKIYVYNQKRYERYYARHGFKNNEWFKLLIYLSDSTKTKSLAEDDYKAGKSGQEIVEKYRDELNEFNSRYRIEIIQRTPSQVTADEIDNADLIYLTDQEGVYGIGAKWNDLNTYLGGTLRPLDTDISSLRFTDDLSDDALLAIYRNCLYHKDGETPTTALIVGNMNHIWEKESSADYAYTNMGKLSFMLDIFYDPADFANFIGGYEENSEHQNNEEGYSTVLSNADVSVYPNGNNGDVYNQGIKNYEKHSQKYNEDITPVTYDAWYYKYFMVYNLIDQGTWIEVSQTSKYSYRSLNGGFRGNSTYQKPVEDGWTWFVPNTSGDAFKSFGQMNNIWKIMHQRTSKKNSTPKVIVTNADYTKEPDLQNGAVEYYFYADEFMLGSPDALKIIYKAMWTPEEVTDPNALSSLVVKRAATGDVIQSQESPAYETEYTCDVRGDFVDAEGGWNGTRMMQYLITATDEKGKGDTVSVFVIFRDSFMLN